MSKFKYLFSLYEHFDNDDDKHKIFYDFYKLDGRVYIDETKYTFSGSDYVLGYDFYNLIPSLENYYGYWLSEDKSYHKCPCINFRSIINCPTCKIYTDSNYKPLMFSNDKYIEIKQKHIENKYKHDMMLLKYHEEQLKKL